MPTFIVNIFWFFLAIAAVFCLATAAYIVCIIFLDTFVSKPTPCPETPESEFGECSNTPSSQSELSTPSITDTLLEYLNDSYSPIHPVRYDDHIVSNLDMDSLDIQSMLSYMSDCYNVDLPIVDLFGIYGSDPTVYQVLCFISRQRKANKS